MSKLREFILRLGGLLNKQDKNRELDEEIESHLQMHIDDNLRSGMTREEARRQAMITLGGIESTKEAYRDQRGWPVLETIWQDTRHGARMLRKNPAFTAVAVISLGLGIGASTAVFSIANGVLLRSLPVPNPQELRVLRWTGTDVRLRSFSGDSTTIGNRLVGDAVAPATFLSLREEGAAFANIFAFAPLDDVVIRARGAASSGRGMIVSDNFFAGLAAQPLIGQVFPSADREADATRQVVITYRWWLEHFAGNPSVLGQTMTLNGQNVTVIGVMPPGFSGVRAGDGRDFYVPLTPGSPFLEKAATSEEHWWVRTMARIKPGISEAKLKAALDIVFTRAASNQMKQPSMLLQPGRGGLAVDRDLLRKPLLLMLGAVGVVMLIACVNLAGLSLARGANRQHELAVRSALGAMRWRLMRQSLVESLLLAVLGGGLGALIALAGKRAIASLLGGATGELRYDISLNLAVLSFCVAVALVAAVLSGLLPALRAGRADPLEALKARGALSAPRLRLGRVLVVAQVGLSLALLTSAGLYLRTVSNLRNIDIGFNPEKLLVFQINPQVAGYSDAQLARFYEQLQEQLAVMPGARDATLIMNPLLDNQTWSGGFSFPNRATPPEANLETHRLVIGERYFSTMGIPILHGRSLAVGDDAEAPNAIVVNEAFSKRYLPDTHPLGQTVRFLRRDWQIVGVCRDTKYGNLKEPAPPTAYLSFRQIPLNFRTSFALRTTVPPLAVIRTVREVVTSINPAIPVARVVTQEQLRDGNISQERLFAALCSALAGLALMLACIGLYGLMAYNVARRTDEIGIRMAIGATPRLIAVSFMREALVVVGLGLGFGLPLMLSTTQLIRSQLYGLPPHDPFTLTLVIGMLLAIAVVAAWLPASRAARVDPMVALRTE